MCQCKLTLAVYLKFLYYLHLNLTSSKGSVEFLVRLANEKGNQCNNH